MLGSTLTRVLEEAKFQVIEFNRAGVSVSGNNICVRFDATQKADKVDFGERSFVSNFDYVINCIGLIKQLINDKNPSDISTAHILNTDFMIWLDEISKRFGTPVIQIGTDCVFSGLRGNYDESDYLDPIDIYGRTKSIGEGSLAHSMLIRCSIIGREQRGTNSLLSWLISQPQGAELDGYINHIWNGVTTLQFSQVALGVMSTGNFYNGVQHLVPKDTVSKKHLLEILAESFGRDDLTIRPFATNKSIDRTLVTRFQERNLELWMSAGYDQPPTVQEMISRYVHFDKLFG